MASESGGWLALARLLRWAKGGLGSFSSTGVLGVLGIRHKAEHDRPLQLR